MTKGSLTTHQPPLTSHSSNNQTFNSHLQNHFNVTKSINHHDYQGFHLLRQGHLRVRLWYVNPHPLPPPAAS